MSGAAQSTRPHWRICNAPGNFTTCGQTVHKAPWPRMQSHIKCGHAAHKVPKPSPQSDASDS
eukprot:4529141-Pyramimonas_sp.AAC.1